MRNCGVKVLKNFELQCKKMITETKTVVNN